MDFNIQYDNVIENRWPDIVVVKKKECLIIGIAIPEDNRLKQKKDEKVEKYNELERELKKIWPLKEAEVIPVIIGALCVVTKTLQEPRIG